MMEDFTKQAPWTFDVVGCGLVGLSLEWEDLRACCVLIVCLD
jgi:hypothetical protein